MGACSSSTSSSNAKAEKNQRIVVPPDMELLPLDQRALAAKDLVRQIEKQKILFKFRSENILPSAHYTISDLATALAALPEVSLLLAGHSNYVAKVAHRQTPEDQERMVQLSQARAESVKKALCAKGVRNEIDCVAMGWQHREPVGCVKIVVIPAVGTNKPVEVGSPVKLGSKREWAKEDLNSFCMKQDADYVPTIPTYKEAPPTLAPLQPHATSTANFHEIVHPEGSMQVDENLMTNRSVYDEWDSRAGIAVQEASLQQDEWDAIAGMAIKEGSLQQDENVAVDTEQPELSHQCSDSIEPESSDSPCPKDQTNTEIRSSTFVDAAKIPKDPDQDACALIHQAAFIQVHSGQLDLDSSARNPLGMFCCSDKPRTKGCPSLNSQICS